MAPSEPSAGRSRRRWRRRPPGSLALGRDVGGHGESDRETQRRAEHGVGDAGVAAGGVEKRLAGGEQAARNGVADDGGGGAVLDAAAGVGPLGLAEERDAGKPAKGCPAGAAACSRCAREARSQAGFERQQSTRGNCGASSNCARLGMRGVLLPSSQIGLDSMARKSRTLNFEQMLDALRAHSFDVASYHEVAGGMMVSKGGVGAVLVPGKTNERWESGGARAGSDAGGADQGRDLAPSRSRLPEIIKTAQWRCRPRRANCTPSTISPKS